jgi:hypothetical protein
LGLLEQPVTWDHQALHFGPRDDEATVHFFLDSKYATTVEAADIDELVLDVFTLVHCRRTDVSVTRLINFF